MRRWLRIGCVAATLSATAAAGPACYGSFEMTRGLHAWNGQATDNKFVNWLLFVGLLIVPVYGVSLVVDGFIFNSVEFWTGNNPVRSGRLAVEQSPDGTITATVGDRELELRPGPQGGMEVFEDGLYLGRARPHVDGSLTLYDAAGEVLEHLDAREVAARRSAMRDVPSR